jgi:Fe-Mn family superoxide dismutase
LATVIAAPVAAGAYALPDLPYGFDALEPFIDTPTMKIHHDKHHATYVANINKATEGKPEVPILDLMADALEAGPAYRNSGGGHYNHAFFWEEMINADAAAKTAPSAQLTELINKSFGSMDEMKAKFEAQAAPGAVFGSGWVWVAVNQKGDALKIVGTPNQDNPLMKGVCDEVMFPILGLDVWEHAYYLKYQNRRPEYVSNWWNVVNWDKVNSNCEYVVKNHAGVSV